MQTALTKHPSLPLPVCKCVCWAEQAIICRAECGEVCRMRQHLVAQACTQQLKEVCSHPFSLQRELSWSVLGWERVFWVRDRHHGPGFICGWAVIQAVLLLGGGVFLPLD